MRLSILSLVFLLGFLQAVLAVTITAAQRKLFTPPKDGCLLWFGSPPPGFTSMNDYLAKSFVPSNGGINLIPSLNKAGITIIDDMKYWKEVSAEFASLASGIVRVIQGAPPASGGNYKNTIFYQNELSQLTKAGTAVTQIVGISAVDGSTRVIWKAGGPNWGEGGTDEADTPKDIFVVPTAGCSPIMRRALGGSCPMPSSKKTGSKASPKKTGRTSTSR